MLRNLLIISSIALAIGCGKTENESDLLDMFFENRGLKENKELYDYSYFDGKTTIFYNAIFDASSEFKPIPDRADRYASYHYYNNELIITSSQSFYQEIERNLSNYDQTRDFQIEMNVKLNKNNDNNFVYLFFNGKINYMNNSFGIGVESTDSGYGGFVYDIFNNKKVISKSMTTSGDNYQLLTIRKVKNDVSFFINKKFFHKMEYQATSEVGVGYGIKSNSKINISKLTISYLD